MRRVSRVAPLLALGLILALALSGCIHEDRSVALNGDGSGTYTLALGLSDQLLALGSNQISATMDQVGAQVKQDGGTYSKRDDGSYTVWTFARPFKSVADLNSLLQQPLTTSNPNSPAPTSASTDSFHVSESSGLFTNSFHVTGHMSMVPTGGQPPETNSGEIGQMLKQMRESFAISMPGWITAHSGGSLSGNTVTYTVHYGEQTGIDVSSSALTAAGVASIAGGLLLLIVVGVLLVLLRRRMPGRGAVAGVPVAVPAAAAPAPYSPISAPAYPPDAPTLASTYPTPYAVRDAPASGPISPDAPTEQG